MNAAKTLRSRALFEFVQAVMSNSKVQDVAHDFGHVERVWAIGIEIGQKEKADLEILEPALLLHDIMRPNGPGSEKGHAKASAKLAGKILPDFSYKKTEIDEITHAITTHSARLKSQAPLTLEAKIVYDADKCDALGYMGCARAALLCSKKGMNVVESAEWYLGRIVEMIKIAPFYTNSAVSVGADKLKISLDYCREILGAERFQKIAGNI